MINFESIVKYLAGTDRTDIDIGGMTLHVIRNSPGPETIRVPEHSVFVSESDVTATYAWNGATQPPIDRYPGMCLFLPANNLLSCEHASTPFSETIIRIPEPALRMASRGEVNFERLPWRFDVAPVSSVYGIAKAFINLVLSENPPPLLIEAMSVAVKVSVVCGLAPQETRAQVVSTQGLTHIRRRRVQEYIEQNIGRQITVEEMARVAAMSTHHFNRSFKVSMGVSPARYLWTRRVEKAKRLLSNTHTPIAAVAMACGFRSQSHFTTSFKQVTQVTPAAWRKAKN